MPTDVIMPQMGESVFEGTITKWLKKPGDKVQRDEPLFEISTDKVDAEIPAPASGVLQEIKAAEGATVRSTPWSARFPPMAKLLRPNPRRSKPRLRSRASRQLPPGRSPPHRRRACQRPQHREDEEDHAAPLRSSAKSPASTTSICRRFPAPASAAASPSRTSWPSSKGHGAPTPARGSRAPPAAAPAKPTAPAPAAVPGDLVPMTQMRKIIAQRMVESRRTSAHVHCMFQVDLSPHRSAAQQN